MINRKSFGTSDFFNIFFKNLLHFLFLCDIIESVPRNIRPVGQAVKTPPSHGGDRGSIPLRVTKTKKTGTQVSVFFVFMNQESRGIEESGSE